MRLTELPSDLIDPGDNDRRRFDVAALQELADSIASHGLAQPVTVRPVSGRYEIVAGERRFRAMRDVLGWDQVPCLVRDMGNGEASAVMLAENTSRVNLNPMEEAEAFEKRMQDGLDIEQLAKMAGVGKDLVKNRLRLLELVPEARDLVRSGQLGVQWGVSLCRLDPEYQRQALKVLAKDVTWNQWNDLCQRLLFVQQEQSLFPFEMTNQVWDGVKTKWRRKSGKAAVELLRRIVIAAAAARLPLELEELVIEAVDLLDAYKEEA